jgi:hypothetical protein
LIFRHRIDVQNAARVRSQDEWRDHPQGQAVAAEPLIALTRGAAGIADAGRRWKRAVRPVPLPVQAIDHATGHLMAAAALRGLAIRLCEQTAITARLSLARTAAALTGCGEGNAGGAPIADLVEADYDPTIEPTPWGPARRLRPPVAVGEVTLQWRLPAAALGSASAQWN